MPSSGPGTDPEQERPPTALRAVVTRPLPPPEVIPRGAVRLVVEGTAAGVVVGVVIGASMGVWNAWVGPAYGALVAAGLVGAIVGLVMAWGAAWTLASAMTREGDLSRGQTLGQVARGMTISTIASALPLLFVSGLGFVLVMVAAVGSPGALALAFWRGRAYVRRVVATAASTPPAASMMTAA